MSDVDVLLSGTEPASSDNDISAIGVLKKGLRLTPAIRRPIIYSAALSVLAAVGRLSIPVLVQQVIDRGLLGADGYRPGLILSLGLVTLAVVVTITVLAPIAEVAMVRGAQQALYELRREAFAHIHRLSPAEHGRHQKGTLLARVTSDVESVARFVEWGLVTWSMNLAVIVGAFIVMLVYSWQLAFIALGTMLLVIPIVRWLQKRQLRAYDRVRTAVGNLLTSFNEVLTGGDAIRSYGYEKRAEERLDVAIDERYRADLGTAKYMATLFTVGDLVGTAALVVVALSAAEWGGGWGLGPGSVVSFFFLLALVQSPIGEITEVLDNTQTAVAGWNKVLTLLETEPELTEPEDGKDFPQGPLPIVVTDLLAGYDGTPVLHGVSVEIPAGTRVAVVGQTGSGKTTLARILCRLMDPLGGSVRLGGVELSEASSQARRRSVRLVPQDGFLFDTTVAHNIAYGRPGATEQDVHRALDELGLLAWSSQLSNGLETQVGPRGEQLSVGERQLVALARAQVADPGLLVLDEATSSVDPETEQAISEALHRLAAGRTVVSIAHRLSTAELADLVLVFDQGRLVEQGSHDELVAADGIYAGLHRSWERSVTGSGAG